MNISLSYFEGSLTFWRGRVSEAAQLSRYLTGCCLDLSPQATIPYFSVELCTLKLTIRVRHYCLF